MTFICDGDLNENTVL